MHYIGYKYCSVHIIEENLSLTDKALILKFIMQWLNIIHKSSSNGDQRILSILSMACSLQNQYCPKFLY